MLMFPSSLGLVGIGEVMLNLDLLGIFTCSISTQPHSILVSESLLQHFPLHFLRLDHDAFSFMPSIQHLKGDFPEIPILGSLTNALSNSTP
ncbi:hypothetical protein VNO77_16790 [Canavalia gladiata]|uniref:Uncharacterized protein n=1 Tax=Canavalia gladiata TaxID=3824 RepID=A0AAN9LHY6_CANGL